MSISFQLICDDITNINVDAIVNSANTSLRKGSGMCKIIYDKAGENKLDNYIISKYGKHFKLNPGEAIITPGFTLPAKYIIHTVTPKFFLGIQEDNIEKLSYCYAAIIMASQKHNITSIAIPCLGIGHHGWPLRLGTSIAVDTLIWSSKNINKNLNIIFCCYNKEQLCCYQDILLNSDIKVNDNIHN